MAASNSPNANAGALLAMARDVAFLLGIALYFSGFLYRQAFFQAFGLPATADTTQFYAYVVYSFEPIRHGWAGLALLVISAAIILAALRRAPSSIAAASRMVITTIAVAFAFALLAYDARAAAYTAFESVREGSLPAVQLFFRNQAAAAKRYGTLLNDAERGRCSIVAETDQDIFVLDQPYQFNGRILVDGALYVIRRSEIAFTKTRIVRPTFY